MLKKRFLIFLLILIFSGCSAEYNLVITNDNTIKESLTVLADNNTIGKNIDEVNKQLNWIINVSEDETEPANFYQKEKIVNYDKSGIKYTYDFNGNNFVSDSEILKSCFETHSFSLKEQILYISADGFKCNESLRNNYQLTINIVADGDVVKGNYNKQIENKYIWNFDENSQKNLYLSIDRTKLEKNDTNILLVVIYLLAIVLIGGILIFIVNVNKKKKNQI